jgi:hypothetical protein
VLADAGSVFFYFFNLFFGGADVFFCIQTDRTDKEFVKHVFAL